MFKNLIMKNQILFEDKINLCVFKFCRYLSLDLPTNNKISGFESFIGSEKLKAKNYFLIEDKCNVLSKLNTKNVSLLLETEVNNIFKWSFNEKSCALVEIKDSNYFLKRDIKRSFGLNSKSHKMSSNDVSRYLALNSCPKVLNPRVSGDNLIHRLSPRNKDSTHLNIYYLRQHFQSNEELIQFLLYNETASDLDLKIRFFIISQLERYICQSHLKDYQILPFGSSIAGLATPSSDLDLVLIPRQLSEDSESINEDRKRQKSNLNLIADLLESSVPFYSQFCRILEARIPIIKFAFDLAPVDIDLSIELSSHSVHHGVNMSAFLSHCIDLNPQIRNLILLLRIWAKQHKLLKPKNWSTNFIYNGFTSFQLTALVIFFLQSQGLVPPMNQFLTNQIFRPSKRQIDLIQLMSQFFEFVSSIRFEWEAISIFYAKTFANPNPSSPIYMENPFNNELNMCRNINRVKFEKFLYVTISCADIMRTKSFNLTDIFDSDLQSPLTNNRKKYRIKAEDLFSD